MLGDWIFFIFLGHPPHTRRRYATQLAIRSAAAPLISGLHLALRATAPHRYAKSVILSARDY